MQMPRRSAGAKTLSFPRIAQPFGRVDVLVSWNFKHMVNLARIHLVHSVNIERGYGLLEIRTPREILEHD